MGAKKIKSSDIALRVEHVSKSFRLPTEQASGIKQAFINRMRGIKGYKEQHVLKNISFTVEKGDFFGIVGRNGSGKSTLLKLISQIYYPDKGKITVNGKLVPFIELGVGFNPELTGRENIYLNGALLGFSHEEVSDMYEEIVEFAELEEFMDQKLKNYSSGMQVRLAFSIAIKAQGDILVLDEVLAVGDEAFQRKCFNHFAELKKNKKTVILVTHSMESMRKFCNKAILIEDGDLKLFGNPDKVANQYSKVFTDEYIGSMEDNETAKQEKQETRQPVRLDSLSVCQRGKALKRINFKEEFSINVDIEADTTYADCVMGVHIINNSGQVVVAMSTKKLDKLSINKGSNRVRFTLQNVLAEGEYYVAVAVEDNETKNLLIKESELSLFYVTGMDKTKETQFGLAYPEIKMEVL